MKFTHSGHILTILADTPADGVEICKHFRLSIEDHVTSLASVMHISGDEERPWFAVSADIGMKWLAPYYTLLEKVTGCAGPFDIEHPDLRYSRHMHLCHTHIVDRAWIDAEGYHATGFIRAEDWNGQSAAQRAMINFKEYVTKALGAEEVQHEFLQLDNGLYKKNPNWGCGRSKVFPQATHKLLFELLVQHWLEKHATPEQFNAWRRGEDCYRKVCKTSTLAERFLISPYDDRIYTNGYNDHVLLADFKSLGANKENTDESAT